MLKPKTPITDAACVQEAGSNCTRPYKPNFVPADLCRKLELENQHLRGLLFETCDFVNRQHDKKVLDEKSLALKLRLEKAASKL